MIGMKMSVRLTERQRALQKFIEILVTLKGQMCGLGVPLVDAFENIGKENMGGVWSNIFKQCSSIMKENHVNAGEAWKRALSENLYAALDEGDIEELYDFGEMLGKSDRYNQEKVLELEKEKLTAMEKKARETMETKGKLYRNLGILTGAAIVILLI
ncbi:MAG: hypothetical protein GX957_08250 [Clostridiaceae bacterium]|nr:hypothetical protein [Clostridiaceae bacterium]